MIPKIIHYCWFGGKPFSPLVEKCMDSWREKLPEYQIKRWDESNSPIENCRFAKQAFVAKKWAFVADYVRLYVLYNEGGIYLDTDMLVLKSFDSFLRHDCFLGLEEPGIASCGIIGAVGGHAYIAEMLELYESMSFDPKRLVPIPQRFSEVLNAKGMTPENVLQEVHGVHIYPTDYFYPWTLGVHLKQKDFMSFVTPNSYAVHLWNASWLPALVHLQHRRYEIAFSKAWEEIRENPFQSLKFYKKVITHGTRYMFQKMSRYFMKDT
jgi:mannosyltransferase OCH1-like enzyme